MMPSPTHTARPVLGLRIGITGSRHLATEALPRLRLQVRAVLDAVAQQMLQLATDNEAVRHAYAKPPDRAIQLRCVSPLAKGADRLVASEALKLGYALHVPMPFPQAEYEADFDTAEDLAEFRALLAQASEGTLELDGEHGPETDRAYEAVGRYVARHCDVLIAIWDGSEAAGRGGTADIVRYGAHLGVPIIWLHASEAFEPLWLTDILDLRYPRTEVTPFETALQDYLQARIPPPTPCHRHRHGALGWLGRLLQAPHVAPEAEHFAEHPLPARGIWRAYSWMMRTLSGASSDWQAPQVPDDQAARYWFERFVPVDARANEYSARYRSAYVWVFVLGVIALLTGGLGMMLSLWNPALHWQHQMREGLGLLCTLSELASLLLICLLVIYGTRHDWHERSIEYRLLAELYRKQQALAPLGASLPIRASRRTSPAEAAAADRSAWVAWLFAAEQRVAPFPSGNLAHAASGAPRRAILDELINEQVQYHTHRGTAALRVSHRLESFGEKLFGLVIVFVLVKLVVVHLFEQPAWEIPLGFFATVLPAISGAVVGLRAYAEWQLLAVQSQHVVAELTRAHERVERLDTARPLASQDLGAEAANVATLMLQDLDGWAQVFRVKGIEAG